MHFSFLLYFQAVMNVDFPTAVTNLLGKAEAWDGSDVRKTNKQKKAGVGGIASFVFLGTEKSDPDQSKAEGRWTWDKEQMECDEGTNAVWKKMQSGKNETVMEEKDEKIWA